MNCCEWIQMSVKNPWDCCRFIWSHIDCSVGLWYHKNVHCQHFACTFCVNFNSKTWVPLQWKDLPLTISAFSLSSVWLPNLKTFFHQKVKILVAFFCFANDQTLWALFMGVKYEISSCAGHQWSPAVNGKKEKLFGHSPSHTLKFLVSLLVRTKLYKNWISVCLSDSDNCNCTQWVLPPLLSHPLHSKMTSLFSQSLWLCTSHQNWLKLGQILFFCAYHNIDKWAQRCHIVKDNCDDNGLVWTQFDFIAPS